MILNAKIILYYLEQEVTACLKIIDSVDPVLLDIHSPTYDCTIRDYLSDIAIMCQGKQLVLSDDINQYDYEIYCSTERPRELEEMKQMLNVGFKNIKRIVSNMTEQELEEEFMYSDDWEEVPRSRWLTNIAGSMLHLRTCIYGVLEYECLGLPIPLSLNVFEEEKKQHDRTEILKYE